ncbi:prepilin-type N-terminal cleavage/methylation domain-containing protein [Acinetobacter schindleri]|nr:prepilin-type N-terminal cleavage/methylation domain-containing protein [Acinetobacter schindleri]
MYRNRDGSRRSMQAGFTLIELMITVAIIAILAAIVLPNYSNYVVRAHRTDAQAAMLNLAQYMESQYNASFSYPAESNIPSSLMSPTNISDYYTFDFDDDATSEQSFKITATPTARQNDTQCGTLTLNEQGAKTPTTSGCWK